jgi:glycosyltransferase involved in cell wall biosynthesis
LLDRYAHTDTRIRVFHQENAGELGKVLNRATQLAQGKYLARQDADDASDASRLENQVKYLEAHPDTGLCGTWVWFIDTSLGPLFSLELPDDHARLNHYLTKGMNPFVHGSIMFRADVFQKMGGYRGSYAEDFDLWLRMSEVTRLGICTALGYYYWRSEGGISSGANLRQQSLNQLSLKLHSERVRLGQEMTDWQSEWIYLPTNQIPAKDKLCSTMREDCSYCTIKGSPPLRMNLKKLWPGRDYMQRKLGETCRYSG